MILRFAIVLVAACGAWAQDVARMEQVIQSYTANHQFMGSVLVAKGTDVILSKGYGSANLEWAVPNSPAHQVPARVHHQTVYGGMHPAAAGARQAEYPRPCQEIHDRRSRCLGQNHNL